MWKEREEKKARGRRLRLLTPKHFGSFLLFSTFTLRLNFFYFRQIFVFAMLFPCVVLFWLALGGALSSGVFIFAFTYRFVSLPFSMSRIALCFWYNAWVWMEGSMQGERGCARV